MRQLLNFVYTWALEQVAQQGPEKLEQWLLDLDAPYWERSSRSRYSTGGAEAEKESFRAAMASG